MEPEWKRYWEARGSTLGAHADTAEGSPRGHTGTRREDSRETRRKPRETPGSRGKAEDAWDKLCQHLGQCAADEDGTGEITESTPWGAMRPLGATGRQGRGRRTRWGDTESRGEPRTPGTLGHIERRVATRTNARQRCRRATRPGTRRTTGKGQEARRAGDQARTEGDSRSTGESAQRARESGTLGSVRERDGQGTRGPKQESRDTQYQTRGARAVAGPWDEPRPDRHRKRSGR